MVLAKINKMLRILTCDMAVEFAANLWPLEDLENDGPTQKG